jgi:hypothetical protein
VAQGSGIINLIGIACGDDSSRFGLNVDRNDSLQLNTQLTQQQVATRLREAKRPSVLSARCFDCRRGNAADRLCRAGGTAGEQDRTMAHKRAWVARPHRIPASFISRHRLGSGDRQRWPSSAWKGVGYVWKRESTGRAATQVVGSSSQMKHLQIPVWDAPPNICLPTLPNRALSLRRWRSIRRSHLQVRTADIAGYGVWGPQSTWPLWASHDGPSSDGIRHASMKIGVRLLPRDNAAWLRFRSDPTRETACLTWLRACVHQE